MYEMEYQTNVGDMAPDFTLSSTSGSDFRLYGCKNKRTVVLFFFDHMKEGCIDRLSSMAKSADRIKDAGAIVVPVTNLNPDEGKALAEKLALPFDIVCDESADVIRMYRVGECSATPAHVCFEIITGVKEPTMLVIDTSGVIRYKHKVDKSGPEADTIVNECRSAAGS